VFLLGSIPFIAFVPWIPELVRSVNDLGRTKDQLVASGVSARAIRDTIVPLFFGEHGAASSTAARGAQALAVIVAVTYSCLRLRRLASREAFWLLAGVMSASLVLYLGVMLVDTDIFQARYMTALLPLAIAVLAGAAASVRWRLTVPAAAALLVALGTALAIDRAGREYEPDTPAAVAAAREHGYRVILTNSPEVAFYGRKLHVILDRPFGLGTGQQRCGRCAVIDDARFGGVRPGSGPTVAVGPIIIRFPAPKS
jgi:hypothetical protein